MTATLWLRRFVCRMRGHLPPENFRVIVGWGTGIFGYPYPKCETKSLCPRCEKEL